MPREKEAYLDNLAAIREQFGDKNTLTVNEVCRYLGKNYRTIHKHIPGYRPGVGYSVYTLARYLS